MNWDRIEASWKQLTDQIVFHWERLRRDDRDALVWSARSSDRQTTGFRPDDHVRRSEFSLHIGC
jgi:hypothetical protein